MLLQMLRTNEKFNALPAERREVFLKLAEVFEDNDLALQLTPKELATKLQVGSKQNWFDFLNLESVDAYVRSQMAMNAKVAQRQAFSSMTKEAMQGDTTAAKVINDVSGILNSGDKNKVVVLHRANRPKQLEA